MHDSLGSEIPVFVRVLVTQTLKTHPASYRASGQPLGLRQHAAGSTTQPQKSNVRLVQAYLCAFDDG